MLSMCDGILTSYQDIESAIREVEEREEGIRVAAQAVMRKQAEEEAGAARRAEEERRKGEEAAAQKRREQKAGDERRDREAKEGQREREARAGEERKAAAERKAKEERQKAKASGGMAGAEWRKWVELQKTIKLSIIEVAKADRALKAPRRLVTRGLGQVVNTREAGLRVVSPTSLTSRSWLTTAGKRYPQDSLRIRRFSCFAFRLEAYPPRSTSAY